MLADSSSGIVVSQSDRLITLIGVDDIVVVDTPDALLVTTSEHAQRVKSVVDALKLSGRTDVSVRPRVRTRLPLGSVTIPGPYCFRADADRLSRVRPW